MEINLLPIKQQISEIKNLLIMVSQAQSDEEKLAVINLQPVIDEFLKEEPLINQFISELNVKEEYLIKSLIAIGQGANVLNMTDTDERRHEQLTVLLKQLAEIENFYHSQGGIIGYHMTVLTLIANQMSPSQMLSNNIHYMQPEGIHLEQDDLEVRQAVRWGIESFRHFAEIYPLGGAADRLNLVDEETGDPLPAAMLHFLGRTLLEGLIRDLQGREYLVYKLTGEQLDTPIAIMTSSEKNNHHYVLQLCERKHWFGRSPKHFCFFIQPLVPVVTIKGNWALTAPLTLLLKPSGHGVLWKLAEDQKVFSWLESLGRSECIVRQINNPLAGSDQGVLALSGIGLHDRKSFGFISCERLINSAEGTNVLIVHDKEGTYEYCLTNIEYTDFNQRGIGEIPAHPGSPFSQYPANTNILYANIKAVRKVIKTHPIPGQIINLKSLVPSIDRIGERVFIPGGRLESTMQNIADYFVDRFPTKLNKEECKRYLKTFVIYNDRKKTISTTKNLYKPGESLSSTPEQAYYDLLFNHYGLLKKCGFKLPSWRDIHEMLHHGPSALFLFHPALGPVYSVIEQKIRGGSLAADSEFVLEIAEANIENLDLAGSLTIVSTSPLGRKNHDGVLKYGGESRCRLKNVTIHNKGINRKIYNNFWRNDIHRREEVKIILHEGAEFDAEGVVLNGSREFIVPSNHRLSLRTDSSGMLLEELTFIDKPSWTWNYTFDDNNKIQLSLSRKFTR